MSANMIRTRPTSHQAMKKQAVLTGNSLPNELKQAILQRQRKVYLEGLKADYAAIKQNPKAFAEFRKETAIGIDPTKTTWKEPGRDIADDPWRGGAMIENDGGSGMTIRV